MGLKADILKAFEDNLTHIQVVDDGGKLKEKTVKPPTEENSKLNILAQDLTNAIVKFIQAQTLVVTELETSQTLTNVTSLPTAPGAPAVIPLINITTAVSDRGQKPTNLKGGGKVESMKSKVKLKRAVEV